MRHQADSIANDIANEKLAIEQFIELLEREQDALTRGEIEALSAISEQKESLAIRLSELAQRRNAALAERGFEPDRPGMDAWRSEHPEQKEGISDWNSILALAAKARELNRVNGELLQMRLKYNSAALEILMRRKDALDVYGPDGLTQSAENRRINDAV